jgi:propanediol dehydratase large subunit
MDWQTIVRQQDELEKSFTGLRMVFEQAERDFKHKSETLMQLMGQQQSQDALSLSKIHQALLLIIDSNNSVKQNQEKK